jgi:hypothetical protein
VLVNQGAKRIKRAYFNGRIVVEEGLGKGSIKAGVERYRWATTVDEMRTAIQDGLPISIGVTWYTNFDNPFFRKDRPGTEDWIGVDTEGKVATASTINNILSETRGGHCVCIYGASDVRQAFKVKNSWGDQYPSVWLPYIVMQKLLDEDGEAALVTDR